MFKTSFPIALVELETLQWKFDFEKGIINKLKALMQKEGVWAWQFFSKMWINREGMTHNLKKIGYVEMTQVCILFSSLVHVEWASQNPSLNPSPYPFDVWANDFLQHFVVIYQYHLAHFEVEDSR